MVVYKKTVSEPWFSLIKLGIKTVEGRLAKGEFAQMKVDDIIEFSNDSFGFDRKFQVKITKINKFKTFESYLRGKKLSKCLPGIDNLTDGVRIYRQFYSEEDEKKFGILAITVVCI